ncbi:MAG: hypothetical protein GXY83_24650 [Rhodopirellula sp.]|nr:hypothetical protein [Rhodopirellula sp.]
MKLGFGTLGTILLSLAVSWSAAQAGSPRILFSDNFEQHAVGSQLGSLKPASGAGYTDTGGTTIVATDTLPGSPGKSDVGKHCARCNGNAALMKLSDPDIAAARGQTVRFRFDLYVTPEGSGGPDIQTFSGDDPQSSRAFNLLVDREGTVQYYSGGAQHPIGGKMPVGAWVPVEILADYQRHVFRARVGDVSFIGRFDTDIDEFTQIYFGKFGEPTYYYDNVVVDLVPELAKELAGAAASFISTEADLLRPLETGVSPFDVGTSAQLFVDRILVRDAERVWFTQHPGRKHPKNPVLKPDQPWEGWRTEIFGNVLLDEEEKLFKMWYLPEPAGDGGYFDDPNVTCYAVSRDGVTWEKPLVGTLKAANGKPHNAVAHIHQASVWKDPRDPEPSRRYKCIGWSSQPPGYNTFVSPDGLNWTKFCQEPIAPGGDVMTGFWDAGRELYVAFPKIYPVARGHNRRLFATIVSKDFVHWTQPVPSFTVDLRDDVGSLARIEQVRPILDRPDDPRLMRTEYYGIGAYPAESCTLAFPWILTVNNNARWGNHEGPEEIQLAVSRDLIHWERPFRTPIIGIGEIDRWDASYHTTAATALRVKDEIWLYYSGANYTHGSPPVYRTTFEDGRPTGRKTSYSAAIGLVTWPLDRFVSADAGSDGGVLTTVPVRHRGDRLEINAAVKPGGQIVMELLDAAGRPLEGFPPSEPFTGDDLRHVVRFAGQTDVSALRGQSILLRFRMKNAELYSFAFRGEGRPAVLRKTPQKLQAGQPVKVVCLGDSVTGIYYHTGGRRAYPEMLGWALKTAFPQTAVTAVNAGISGNSTIDGLNRLQKDVLDHKPDLVTIMFGLNDMVRVPKLDFQVNLGQMIQRCRQAGAEVILCTPNSVIDTPGRPIPRLVEYCGAIKEVAQKYEVPLSDVYATYESLRARDPLAWRLLLSDEIHPNMDGHKLNAETLCRSITGQEISLKSAGPPQPALPKTLALVKAGQPVRILAMAPYDKLIGPVLQAAVPSAKIEVKSWPTAGQTMAQIEEAAKAVRNVPPDLILIAVPLAVTPPAQSPPEEAIRSHSWILNWSLSFGLQEWDAVAIAPSVLNASLNPQERLRDEFARRMISAQDLNLISRPDANQAPPQQILETWFRTQLSGK